MRIEDRKKYRITCEINEQKPTQGKEVSIFNTILQLLKTGPNKVFQRLPAVVRGSWKSISNEHKTSLRQFTRMLLERERSGVGKSVPMTRMTSRVVI